MIRFGRPFWSGFTAFFANMVALAGLDALNVDPIEMEFRWAAATVASLFVAGAVYGREKLAEFTDRHNGKAP